MPLKQDLIGKTVLTYWQVDEFIGSGGYGNVYKAHRYIGNDITYAAIKHIVIPEPEQYKERLISNRNNTDQTDKYFKKLYVDILNEIRAMDKLTGKSANIVAYRNHEVIEHHEPKRYEIIIEMEYLKPFSTYCIEKNMTVGEVLKMGMEIASAIDVCHSKDIMHRDIKESNIFIDSDGNFKLGDFGLAKILTESSKAKSDAGTVAYKAPEVAIPFSEYRKTVDIYSLGIVLYRMFNNGRIPFLPPYPEEYDYDDETNALGRRLRSEPLPRPRCATKGIADVILKACSPKPEDRYQTAAEMRMAIKLLMSELNKEEMEKPVDLLPGEYAASGMNGSSMFNNSFGKPTNHDENYVHENIFSSSNGKRKRENTSLEEKDRLLWETAKKEGTEKAVREYLDSNNSQKAFTYDACKWLDSCYWAETCRIDSISAYDWYLKMDLPVKAHIEEAKLKIEKIGRIAVDKGSITGKTRRASKFKAGYIVTAIAVLALITTAVVYIVNINRIGAVSSNDKHTENQAQQPGIGGTKVTALQSEPETSIIETKPEQSQESSTKSSGKQGSESQQQTAEQTRGSTTRPPEQQNAQQPANGDGLKVSDYFPLKDKVHISYAGIESEFAQFDTYVEFVKGNIIQVYEESGDCFVHVYELGNGMVKQVYYQPGVYELQDFTSSRGEEEIIIKEPLKTGAKWVLSNGNKRSITAVDKRVPTPLGTYKALEVTTEGSDTTIIDYYARGIGLVKRIYRFSNGEEMSSEIQLYETGVTHDY